MLTSSIVKPHMRRIAFPAIVPRASSGASERSGSKVLQVFNAHCRSMLAETVQSLTFVADNKQHVLEELVRQYPHILTVKGGVINSRGGAAAMAYAEFLAAGSPASATSATM